MNKLKLATLTLLLAGGTALPALADDDRGAPGGRQLEDRQGGRGESDASGGRQVDHRDDRREWRGDRGAPGGRPVEQRDDRREWRGDSGAPGGPHGAHPGDRRDSRGDHREWRDDRREWRGDRRDWRDDRRDWRDDRRDWRDDRRDWRDDRRDWRDDRRDHRRYSRHDDRRWNGYHWYPQYRYRAPVRYVYPSGYRAYQWRVGHRLPRGYYDRDYYVDYRHYRLPPPPYGYHWVRVDRDVVLVAVATGLILDVLHGLYY